MPPWNQRLVGTSGLLQPEVVTSPFPVRMFFDHPLLSTGLAVTPSVWGAIEKALADSDCLLLMASPEADASPWVRREVD